MHILACCGTDELHHRSRVQIDVIAADTFVSRRYMREQTGVVHTYSSTRFDCSTLSAYKTGAKTALPAIPSHLLHHRHIAADLIPPPLEESAEPTEGDHMGAEAAHPQQQPPSSVRPCREAAAPAVLGLQLSALIDHVARVDWSLLDRVPGDRGGSQQVLPSPSFLPPSIHAQHGRVSYNSLRFNCSMSNRPSNSQVGIAIPVRPSNVWSARVSNTSCAVCLPYMLMLYLSMLFVIGDSFIFRGPTHPSEFYSLPFPLWVSG
jgi:hypothetical protein